jgi:hypothetical protein
MLVARSSPECHLYIQLHPCSCGERALVTRHAVVSAPVGLVARYEGTCGTCGAARRFEFQLDPELPPDDAFGGFRPSQIVCPGEYALHSDDLASRWPASVESIRPADRARARHDLAWAVSALEEVLKFIPPGADAVPAAAFTSPAGRAAHAAEPGRFRAVRIAARLGAYRTLLADFDRLN